MKRSTDTSLKSRFKEGPGEHSDTSLCFILDLKINMISTMGKVKKEDVKQEVFDLYDG